MLSFVQSVAIAALASTAFGHMAVLDPPPLRSKHNPQYNGGNVDFNMLSPLSADGSNFPCKGYLGDVPSVSSAVATLVAGQTGTIKMEGSASHGGGSCQFSISYDGKTWGVMDQKIGGCPLDPSYTFKIPAGLPSAKNVFLSWTWFNMVGNREMYQNCIAVNVNGTSSGKVTLPRMFEANIGNGCTVPEGTQVDFNSPPCGITPDQKVTIGPSGSSNGGGGGGDDPAPVPAPAPAPEGPPPAAPPSSSSPSPAPTTAPGGDGEYDDDCPPENENDDGQDDGQGEEDDCPPENDDPAPSPTPSAPSAPAPSTPAPPASAPPPPSNDDNSSSGGSCTPGAYLCSADGKSWSMCANGVWIKMGAVAPGTECRDGKHVALVSRERATHLRRHERMVRRLARDH